jgi:arylsulfatase A-like enzyme
MTGHFSLLMATGLAGCQLIPTVCSALNEKKTQTKPNIIWLIAEDISPALGCYGDPQATTPHLDKFASKGVVFTNAWSTAPICAPSRSCLITGLYATSLGTQHLRSEVTFPSQLKRLPELLKQQGYFTTNRDKTDYNFSAEGMFDHWSSAMTPWRHRKEGQPFFSFINIGPSHEGTVNKLDSYRELTRDLAPALLHDPAKVKLPPYYPDSPETRQVWAHYYDILTVLDRNVGSFLDSLRKDNLMDETIIFFIADHGFGMPRYKRWLNKTGMNVPLVIHFPEKYKDLASDFIPGTHNDKLISFIDMAPTTLSLAGAGIPSWMEGKPFLGNSDANKRELAFGARDRADDMVEMSRSVTDGKHIYIRHFMPHLPYIQPGYIYSDEKEAYKALRKLHKEGKCNAEQEKLWNPKPIEELYDLVADPSETNNLATNQKYAGIKEILKKKLHSWMLQNRDLGLLAEPEYMIRGALTSPYDYARKSGRYQVDKILQTAEMVGVATEKELSVKLKDPESGVRYWAVLGLRQFSSVELNTLNALEKALDDESPSVRIVASEALCHFGKPEKAVTVLGKWVVDDRPWLALQAARNILLVGNHAKPIISEMRKVLEKNLALKAGGKLKYRDFNYAAFTSWSLEWALQEMGEKVQVN